MPIRNVGSVRLWLICALALAAAIAPCESGADDTERLPGAMKNDQLFKTLCIGEKSTGFNWRNNEWNFTRFKPEKYFIEKLKPERSARTLLCWSEAKEKTRYESADSTSDWGCYSVREGEQDLGPPHLAYLCLEDWKTVNGSFVLQTVSCEGGDKIHFKPDGNFDAVHWSGYNGELAEKSNDKDSLSITVGRCSIIR
jgi:hypothetical protein